MMPEETENQEVTQTTEETTNDVKTPSEPQKTEAETDDSQQRLQEAVNKALQDAVKRAGYQSFDDVLESANKHREAVRSNQSELEVAKSDLESYKTKYETTVSELRDLQLQLMINDHLADNHKDYVGKKKWILPLVRDAVKQTDGSDDANRRAMESVVKAFIKDNPVQQDVVLGSGAGPQRSGTQGNNAYRDQVLKIAEDHAKSAAYRSGVYVPTRK
jgi:hypothetical protein